MTDQKNKDTPDSGNIDFHEAAIIDEQGNEIEITEEMVRRAINKLDDEAYPETKTSS
jgi:hypothetical protein